MPPLIFQCLSEKGGQRVGVVIEFQADRQLIETRGSPTYLAYPNLVPEKNISQQPSGNFPSLSG